MSHAYRFIALCGGGGGGSISGGTLDPLTPVFLVATGAAIYTQHDGDATLFGVYSQECVSGWGPISKKDAHCAVRIGASAYRIICDEASKLGYTMQECSNPVLQGTDIG